MIFTAPTSVWRNNKQKKIHPSFFPPHFEVERVEVEEFAPSELPETKEDSPWKNLEDTQKGRVSVS